MITKNFLSLIGVAALVSGCASPVSEGDFLKNPQGASNLRICKSLQANGTAADSYFRHDLQNELARRRFDPAGCPQLINDERRDAAVAIGAVAAVAVVANEMNKDEKKDRAEEKKYHDEGWRWEKEYYRGSAFWVCRNANTGKEGDERYCKDERNDRRDDRHNRYNR